MPRKKKQNADHDRARRLADTVRRARGTQSRNDVAGLSGVAPDTIKRIEDSRTADPGFFTVARLAAVLGLHLDDLAALALSGKPKT